MQGLIRRFAVACAGGEDFPELPSFYDVFSTLGRRPVRKSGIISAFSLRINGTLKKGRTEKVIDQ